MCFTNKYLVSFCGLSFLNVFDLLLDFQRLGVSLYFYPCCRCRLLLIGTEGRAHGRVRDSQFFHKTSVFVTVVLLNLSGYVFQYFCLYRICGFNVIIRGLEQSMSLTPFPRAVFCLLQAGDHENQQISCHSFRVRLLLLMPNHRDNSAWLMARGGCFAIPPVADDFAFM